MFRIDKSSVELSKSTEECITPYTTIAQQLKHAVQEMDGADEQESAKLSPEKALMEKASMLDEKRRALEQQQEAANRRQAEAESEAVSLLESAKTNSDAMLEQAKTEAEELRRKGHDEGFAEGREAGLSEALLSEQKSLDELSAFIDSIRVLRDEAIGQASHELLELSIEIAEKILSIELDRNDEAFIALVQSAISKMRADGKMYLSVSKQEYERFFQSGRSPIHLDDESVQLVIVPDGHLGRGSCLIEADGQTINASVDSQLQSVEDAFFENESDAENGSDQLQSQQGTAQ